MEDPEKQKLANERAKAARAKVTECRKSLRLVYQSNPELFSETDKKIAFAKKPGSHNYLCVTFTTLNEILERVQGVLMA